MKIARLWLLLWSASVAPVFAETGGQQGMPQLNQATYPSQLFWLAVFFLLFYGFMSLFAMPRLHRILLARQTRISDDLAQATAASNQAETLKQEIEGRLTAAREEARSLIAGAQAELQKSASAREAVLSTELTKRIESAEAEIAAVHQQALSSVDEIAAAIMEVSIPKLIGTPANDTDTTRALKAVNKD